MHPGDPNELVAIDFTFDDETFHISSPLHRWRAEHLLRVLAEFGVPVMGKRVAQALIVPMDRLSERLPVAPAA